MSMVHQNRNDTIDVGIVTGWSEIGGSTEAYRNLVSLLESNGITCKLYGPTHSTFLRDTTYGGFNSIRESYHNNIIWHYVPFNRSLLRVDDDPNLILSCHEHDINIIAHKYNQSSFNYIHFVGESQARYQLCNFGDHTKVSHKVRVIPNAIDQTLQLRDDTNIIGKVGAVIGSIYRNKQTHVSIHEALMDGCDEIRLYGACTDIAYYDEWVKPMLSTCNTCRVINCGIEYDKNKMYHGITDVYHYSARETWGYVKAECDTLGIPFHSMGQCDANVHPNGEILKSWREILCIL